MHVDRATRRRACRTVASATSARRPLRVPRRVDALPVAPPRVKVQIVGPLTLGVALEAAGLPRELAFERAGDAVRAWVRALEELLAVRLPGTPVLLFLDEPSARALAPRRGAVRPRGRRSTSCPRASPRPPASPACTSAATATFGWRSRPARPCSACRCRTRSIADADVLARHIDADGWVAWGAVPTDRPIGDSADALWRRLAVGLVRADPPRLRPGPAAHPRDHHSGVRSRRARAHPGRARAAPRRGHRGPRRRPGGRGPPHRRRVARGRRPQARLVPPRR